MSKKLSPAQQQYMELKQQHNDCLLFFRLGDFYEVFYDDAKIAHKVLGITLTARNKKADNPIPMAGIPHHALEKYVPLLIQAGYKIALAEQVGTVQPGKIVERRVTQVITPGTYIGPQSTEQYILAITQQQEKYHLARGDFTIGKYYTNSVNSYEALLQYIQTIGCVELIIDTHITRKQDLLDIFAGGAVAVSQHGTPYDIDTFVLQQLGVETLSGYGKALSEGRNTAAGLLFQYLSETQKRTMGSVYSLQYIGNTQMMHIDAITVKNLEMFQSSYEGSKEHSLFGVIDTCVTAMGSRLLASWLKEPSMDTHTIQTRAGRIQRYMNHDEQRRYVQSWLKHCPDLPRLLTSIIYRKPSPSKIQALVAILSSIFTNELSLMEIQQQGGVSQTAITELEQTYLYLSGMIKEGVIQESKDFILDGVDAEVDRLRQIAYSSDELLLAYQKKLVIDSGVTNVKITFIRNQGYSLEVTPKDIQQFETIISPDDPSFDLVRTQSLKGGQRYVSTYLTQLQQEILNAAEQLIIREGELLKEIIFYIESHAKHLFGLADVLGLLDLSASHASYSIAHDWNRPDIVTTGSLDIQGGFHPVVKTYLQATDQFIPNDLALHKKDYFHLITGPNMGGKSTYLRQNALIVLLAHAGCMVPAASADIPVYDGIFARVGSGDALAKNQSTFMTEMIEMANILHHASEKSFIVLDELGRGTSTYDGLSLAKAITVYICQDIQAQCLFATHYHELTALEGVVPGCSNWRVDVLESESKLVFLKKIVQGGASKSYGLDVAKLAGIPHQVTALAESYLHELETGEQYNDKKIQQGVLFQSDKTYDHVLRRISSVDLNTISPLELMNLIAKIQQEIQDVGA